MNKKLMMSADEVAETLGVSMSHAYKIVRALNKDLESKGCICRSLSTNCTDFQHHPCRSLSTTGEYMI